MPKVNDADLKLIIGADIKQSEDQLKIDMRKIQSWLNTHPLKIKSEFDKELKDVLDKVQGSGSKKSSGSTSSAVADANKLASVERQRINLISQATIMQQRFSAAQNSSNSASRDAYGEIGRIIDQLNTMGSAYDTDSSKIGEFQQDLKNLSNSLATQGNIIKAAGDNTMSFGDKLKQTAARYGLYLSASRIMLAAIRAIKQMAQASIELDTSFTQLQIVTGATNEELKAFSDTAANLAKNLGQSITSVTKSIETFSRLGYSLPDASKLAEYATILANTAGVDVNEATTGVTSIIKGFGLDVSDAEHAADILIKVGQEYAVSASEMMEAYEKSGAALNATNTSLEKSAGLIAAANASVQNASTVGTALKTVSARIRGSKSDLESLGEDVDELADGFSKYANEIKALTGFDIMLDRDKGTFKDIYDIFEGTSGVWEKLSDTQQARVAEILGGTRQLQVVASIIGNWKDAAGAYDAATNSAGTALKANEIYMESAQAHINQLKASFEEFSYATINTKVIGSIVEIGSAILTVLTRVNELTAALALLGGIKIFKHFDWLSKISKSFKDIITSSKNFVNHMNVIGVASKFTGKEVEKGVAAFKLLNKEEQIQILSAKKLSQFDAELLLGLMGLDEEERKEILTKAGYITATEGQTAANSKLAISLKTVAAGIWETTKAFLASPIGMIAVIIAGVYAGIKAVDAYNKRAEKANEELNNTRQELENIKNELSSAQDELNTIKARIDELNKKDKLTFTEEEELNNLKAQNAELQRNIDLLNLQAKAKQNETNEGFVKTMEKTPGAVYLNDEAFSNQSKHIQWFSELQATQKKIKDLDEAYANDLNNSKYLKAREKYNSRIQELTQALLADSSKYGEYSKDILYIEEPTTEADKKVNKWLDFINDFNDKVAILTNGENAKTNAFNRLITTSFNETTTELQKLGEQGKVTAEELSDERYDDFIDKCIELGIISDNSEDSLNLLALAFNKFNDEASNGTEVVSSFEQALSKLQSVSSGLDILDKIYSDIADQGDFDWSSIINNEDFSKTFSSLGDDYNSFIQTILNNTGNIEACQSAFDALTTAYINQSGILENLTEDTRDIAIAMLEQVGVENAATIVDEQLAIQKERLRVETEVGTNATYAEINAMMNEVGASNATKQALFELVVQKARLSSPIDLSQNIDQIIAMAKNANVATAYIENLVKAKELLSRFDSTTDPRGKSAIASQIRQLTNATPTYNNSISAIYGGGSSYRGYTGGSKGSSGSGSGSSSSGSSSSSSEKVKTWFEEQYALHKHLVAMEQETDKAYFDWLNWAYQKAYGEGILTLDDYRKYQEEVFSGLQKLFKDYLSDIEHEISMRGNYDNENKKIISLYNQLISDVEKEINAARSRGLDNTSDYIQELQKKWQNYKDAIKKIQDEVTKNAKDAVKSLVDIRIKMLKQDISNEKDTIKKKLEMLKEFYQKQKDMLQDAYDDEKYFDEQAEKRKAVSDLQIQLNQLEYDDSAWAKKRKLELEKELVDAQSDLDDFEKEHALKVAQEELDKLYEMQEAELNAQTELLETKENDAKALYEQALADIKSGSVQLYEEMIEWNNVYGDGISDTITSAWEEAYKALEEYKNLYDSLYNGINLSNATGYKSNTGSWNSTSVSGTGSATNPTTSTTTSIQTVSSAAPAAAPSLTKGSYVNVKSGTRWYADSYGGGRSGNARSGTIKYINLKGSHPYNIEGLGWIKKTDIVGYASGTKHATYGLHSLDELGSETIFESANGTKYKMFTGGEKVLNARASNFLYDFATKGSEIISKLLSGHTGAFGNITTPIQNNEINMGDIIIQGNADKSTVSEIRRAQRASLETVLKEFNKLNK